MKSWREEKIAIGLASNLPHSLHGYMFEDERRSNFILAVFILFMCLIFIYLLANSIITYIHVVRCIVYCSYYGCILFNLKKKLESKNLYFKKACFQFASNYFRHDSRHIIPKPKWDFRG